MRRDLGRAEELKKAASASSNYDEWNRFRDTTANPILCLEKRCVCLCQPNVAGVLRAVIDIGASTEGCKCFLPRIDDLNHQFRDKGEAGKVLRHRRDDKEFKSGGENSVRSCAARVHSQRGWLCALLTTCELPTAAGRASCGSWEPTCTAEARRGGQQYRALSVEALGCVTF